MTDIILTVLAIALPELTKIAISEIKRGNKKRKKKK